MNAKDKTKEELIEELSELKLKNAELTASYNHIVAEYRQEDALLQQTRKNYETFFNTIRDFLFVLDTQGNIIHTNSTVIDRLGYTKEELTGHSVLMVHPVHRRDEAARIVGEMLSGSAESCPIPVISKSGVQIPVETRVTRGMWDGKPALFGVTKDVSQVKLSEEKFSKLFYLNPSVCGLSDLETGEYIEVNDVFYDLLGFNKNEVIGKTAIELGILTVEDIKTIMQHADSHGKLTNIKTNLRASNGDIKHVLLSAENIYIQDKKYRFTFANDITDLTLAEEKIRLKNEELIKLNFEKDKFFSIIAHDLHNPFNSILGFSNLIKEKVVEEDYQGIGDYAEIVYQSSNHVINLLKNLMEWAQSQIGRIAFKPENLEVEAIVDEVIRLYENIASEKYITVKKVLLPDSVVCADKSMTSTVFRNLISNAIKFTQNGGMIIITEEKKQDEIVFSIQDSGIGMEAERVEKLFKIDKTVSTNGTNNEKGTGLGLILCKEFVEKHGGKIWVDSVYGKGSTFYFSYPNNSRS